MTWTGVGCLRPIAVHCLSSHLARPSSANDADEPCALSSAASFSSTACNFDMRSFALFNGLQRDSRREDLKISCYLDWNLIVHPCSHRTADKQSEQVSTRFLVSSTRMFCPAPTNQSKEAEQRGTQRGFAHAPVSLFFVPHQHTSTSLCGVIPKNQRKT